MCRRVNYDIDNSFWKAYGGEKFMGFQISIYWVCLQDSLYRCETLMGKEHHMWVYMGEEHTSLHVGLYGWRCRFIVWCQISIPSIRLYSLPPGQCTCSFVFHFNSTENIQSSSRVGALDWSYTLPSLSWVWNMKVHRWVYMGVKYESSQVGLYRCEIWKFTGGLYRCEIWKFTGGFI